MMRFCLRRRLQAGFVLVCTVVVTCFSVSVRAEDMMVLEQQTAELQSELDGINQEILSVSDEIASIEMQQEMMMGEILRTETALEEARATEQEQYDSMKSRIKYLYESGDVSGLEILFSAESMSDLLNKADFIRSISEYDRDMLEKYCDVRKNIAEKDDILQAQKKALDELQTKLAARKEELQIQAESTSTDLDTLTARLQSLQALTSGVTDGSASEVVQTGTVYQAQSWEVDILAAILECEAYPEYKSLMAVATIIMNRIEDPRFPDRISDVVYASNQFEPVTLGSLDAVLSRGPSELSYQVAQEALNGARLAAVMDCYYFLYAGATGRPGVNVGDNLFFPSW